MLREHRYQCPCCDYFVLEARGFHQVCPVCCWEDDGIDVDTLDAVSKSNHITLRQARANFAEFGASDQAALSLAATAEQIAGLRREYRARG